MKRTLLLTLSVVVALLAMAGTVTRYDVIAQGSAITSTSRVQPVYTAVSTFYCQEYENNDYKKEISLGNEIQITTAYKYFTKGADDTYTEITIPDGQTILDTEYADIGGYKPKGNPICYKTADATEYTLCYTWDRLPMGDEYTYYDKVEYILETGLTLAELQQKYPNNNTDNIYSTFTNADGTTGIVVLVNNYPQLDAAVVNNHDHLQMHLNGWPGYFTPDLLTFAATTTGVTNLVVSGNTNITQISDMSASGIKRVILPDDTNLDAITFASESYKPILQTYNTQGQCERVKTFAAGQLAAIGSKHYYIPQIEKETDFTGPMNEQDIAFIDGVMSRNIDLSGIQYTGSDISALTSFRNATVQHLALPDLGTKPSDPTYAGIVSGCPQLKAVGQFIAAEHHLNAVTTVEGDLAPLTKMLRTYAGTQTTGNQWSDIKSMKLTGPLNASDLLTEPSETNGLVAADGHFHFGEATDEYAIQQTRTYVETDGSTTPAAITRGAMQGLFGGVITNLDLSGATFSCNADLTLSAYGLLNSKATTLLLPTDPSITDLPADMLDGVSGITEICIPGNIQRIHARAFRDAPLLHVYTTAAATDPDDLLINRPVFPDVPYYEFDNGLGTITLPYGLRFIGSHVFGGVSQVSDVYLLNPVAPVCNVNAFSTKTYVANNSCDPLKVSQKGYITREAYRKGSEAYTMAVLHYPRQCTDNQARLYTDITRQYTVVSDDVDARGKVIYYPTQAEWERAFHQGTTGYLWNAFFPWDNGSTGGAKGFLLNSTELNKAQNDNTRKTQGNIGYGNYDSQSIYQAFANEVYRANDDIYSDKTQAVFYDTSINPAIVYNNTTYGPDAALPYNTTLYNGDYRGWHQFVLAARSTTKAGEVVPDFNPEDFSDNEWWSICEPFPLTAAELRKCFGQNVKLVRLEYVKRDPSTRRLTLHFGKDLVAQGDLTNTSQFRPGDTETGYTLQRGVGYLIKPALPEDWTVDERLLSYTEAERETNHAERFEMDQSKWIEILETGRYTVPAYLVNNTGIFAEEEKDGGRTATIGGLEAHEAKNMTYTALGTLFRGTIPMFCYTLGWNGKLQKVQFYWKDFLDAYDHGERGWNAFTTIIVPNYRTDLSPHIETATGFNTPVRYNTKDQATEAIGYNDLFQPSGNAGTCEQSDAEAIKDMLAADSSATQTSSARVTAINPAKDELVTTVIEIEEEAHTPHTTGAYNVIGQPATKGEKGIIIQDGKKYLSD